jgi:hypothetical protein
MKIITPPDWPTSATSPLAYPSSGQLPVGQLASGNAAAAWKNRCSERRDRINAQNMQIALAKLESMKK